MPRGQKKKQLNEKETKYFQEFLKKGMSEKEAHKRARVTVYNQMYNSTEEYRAKRRQQKKDQRRAEGPIKNEPRIPGESPSDYRMRLAQRRGLASIRDYQGRSYQKMINPITGQHFKDYTEYNTLMQRLKRWGLPPPSKVTREQYLAEEERRNLERKRREQEKTFDGAMRKGLRKEQKQYLTQIRHLKGKTNPETGNLYRNLKEQHTLWGNFRRTGLRQAGFIPSETSFDKYHRARSIYESLKHLGLRQGHARQITAGLISSKKKIKGRR